MHYEDEIVEQIIEFFQMSPLEIITLDEITPSSEEAHSHTHFIKTQILKRSKIVFETKQILRDTGRDSEKPKAQLTNQIIINTLNRKYKTTLALKGADFISNPTTEKIHGVDGSRFFISHET